MCCVVPGLEDTSAPLLPLVRRLSRLDLPTLDRPMTATSGRPSGGGQSSASSVALTNSTFCIFLSSTMRISGSGSVWPSAPTRSTGLSHLDANISLCSSSTYHNPPPLASLSAARGILNARPRSLPGFDARRHTRGTLGASPAEALIAVNAIPTRSLNWRLEPARKSKKCKFSDREVQKTAGSPQSRCARVHDRPACARRRVSARRSSS
mmetsp:Transcript_12036/g.55809  ORF Transcript_12036/g.55809 Transcript_12036/m.55809 type:complete len:209 (+) Transcript_12036:1962-2588(+)